jgi:hypothetical protein
MAAGEPGPGGSMVSNTKRPSTLVQGKVTAVAAFDEIVIGLRQPPMVSVEAHEIAAQLRVLADTVRAGRDEWVVATARKAQRLSALGQRRGFWCLL